METYLILRLDAPLMAFGDVAIDEIRPTDVFPGASLLAGLLGNALGLRYPDQPALDRLQSRLVFASRLDRRGQDLRDYQTAQINKKDILWRTNAEIGSEKERKGGIESYKGPVQRYRHYRADCLVTVALTLNPFNEDPVLDRIAQALARPARPLFLGRCCCPPSRPIHAGELVMAASPRQALEQTASVGHADPGPWLAEWPVADLDAPQPQPCHLLLRRDRRDWHNDVHSGVRPVTRGMLHLQEDPS
ncbi:type I-E CRISPR-associated protein Cas5/CasD [Fundidesulfovibrio putealis]|uniref:type I-E CRISPR-associated protein Cas5/CasD n=1 Tax=Fundidesulfovibrio putealis TaxID=270496 RepID=UPI0004219B66|nr:type I-E CRISPR-associated protein Cas5/CasD [Fundidesulfovibrio putealis]